MYCMCNSFGMCSLSTVAQKTHKWSRASLKNSHRKHGRFKEQHQLMDVKKAIFSWPCPVHSKTSLLTLSHCIYKSFSTFWAQRVCSRNVSHNNKNGQRQQKHLTRSKRFISSVANVQISAGGTNRNIQHFSLVMLRQFLFTVYTVTFVYLTRSSRLIILMPCEQNQKTITLLLSLWLPAVPRSFKLWQACMWFIYSV